MDRPLLDAGRVFVHAPYGLFNREPGFFIERGLQPELYLSSRDLKRFDRREARELSVRLEKAGLACTFHAPFLELNPGALDREVRLLTLARHRACLEAASLFRPQTVVFHPGYDRWRYDGRVDLWLEESLKTWRPLLKAAGKLVPGTRLLVENIFDDTPESLGELLRAIDRPDFGLCFDTGHFQIFGLAPLDDWLDLLGGRLGEVHLHDNDGSADQHLPPGKGCFPFEKLFERLRKDGPPDVRLTLESHTREHLEASLEWLGSRFAIVNKLL